MTPLFQLIKPSAPRSDEDLAARYGQVLDLSRRFEGQTNLATLTDPVTKRRVLCLHSLPAAVPDMSLYEPNIPSSLVDGLALNEGELEERIAMLETRIEESIDAPTFPLHTAAGGRRFTLTTVSGLVSGVQLSAPFSVAWLGGQRWRVSGGRVSGGGFDSNTQEISGADIELATGFLGFWTSFTPEPQADFSRPFRFTVSGLSGVAEFVQSPAKKTLPAIDAGEDALETWTSGTGFVPLAWVTTSRRPTIVPIAGGGNLRFQDTYPLGIPQPVTDFSE